MRVEDMPERSVGTGENMVDVADVSAWRTSRTLARAVAGTGLPPSGALRPSLMCTSSGTFTRDLLRESGFVRGELMNSDEDDFFSELVEPGFRTRDEWVAPRYS